MSKLDPEPTRALTVGGVLSRKRCVHASAGAARCRAEAGCSPVGDESMWAPQGGGEAGLSSCLLLRDLIGSALISAGVPLASQPLHV